MKNIYFKKSDSVLRKINEEKKKEKYKPINWDRIVYFVLLIVIIFFAGRFVFSKIYYVKADGHVLYKNVNIQNLKDCRILNFHVEEGDSVKKGDTLFLYFNQDDNNISVGISSGTKNQTWADREIIELEKNISLNGTEIRQLKELEISYGAELNKVREEVMLDALPKSTYTNIESKLTQLQSNLYLLKNKNAILYGTLNKLKNQATTPPNISVAFGQGVDQGNLSAFLSPMDGIVTQLFKENLEVALKSEIIMYIHQHENVFIKAFFEQEDLSHLKEQDLVDIEFPDGTESTGKIGKFYFSTYKLPEEFQKKYEPTTRSLSVDIVPVNKNELFKWRTYYKMGVIIRKKRY